MVACVSIIIKNATDYTDFTDIKIGGAVGIGIGIENEPSKTDHDSDTDPDLDYFWELTSC